MPARAAARAHAKCKWPRIKRAQRRLTGGRVLAHSFVCYFFSPRRVLLDRFFYEFFFLFGAHFEIRFSVFLLMRRSRMLFLFVGPRSFLFDEGLAVGRVSAAATMRCAERACGSRTIGQYLLFLLKWLNIRQ